MFFSRNPRAPSISSRVGFPPVPGGLTCFIAAYAPANNGRFAQGVRSGLGYAHRLDGREQERCTLNR